MEQSRSLRVSLLAAADAWIVRRGEVVPRLASCFEILDGACEVEFADDEERTYAELALRPEQLLALHHRPQRAA